MRRPDIANNPDFQRRALVTILGIIVIVGAFWVVTRPADTFNSTDFSDNKILATPLVTAKNCLTINNPDTVGTYDENLPIYKTAWALLKDLQPADQVSVQNGDRIEIVDGDDYAQEALTKVWNGTTICDN